jgi:rhodanese-related sulfurtransferase
MADRSKQLISALELRAEMQDSALQPLVVDVRSQADYQNGHIPDAINIPADEVPESLPQITTGQPVVLYCDMRHPGVSRSERTADLIRKTGLQARVLEGGFPAWEAAEYPVDRKRQFHQAGNV